MAAFGDPEGQYRGCASPGTLTQGISGPDVPSAAGLLVVTSPLRYSQRVSGALAITLIPLPYEGFEGTIALIPTGAFTGATGGTATAQNKPIGLAFTAVVGKTLFLTYLPSTGLWYPSY